MSTRKDPESDESPRSSDAGTQGSESMPSAADSGDHDVAKYDSAREADTTDLDVTVMLNALTLCLDDVFASRTIEPESPLRGLLHNLDNLIRSVRNIQNHNSWDTHLCISFISGLLERVVNKSASKLEEFVASKHCILEFERTAAMFTSALLSEHMKRLKDGDLYLVVSDLASWRDEQLEEFREYTKVAVESGAHVLRVFNLMRRDPIWNKLPSKDKKTILEGHLQDSNDWASQYKGKYEVKIFAQKDFDDLKAKRPGAKFLEQEIEDAHFGIFEKTEEGQRTLVEYEVKEFDLSKMSLQKDMRSIEDHRKIFLTIWDAASPLNKESISAVLKTKAAARSGPLKSGPASR